jgi:hypothetical protein
LSPCLRCLAFLLATVLACGVAAQADPASALRTKYASLSQDLRQNQFQRPLVLVSTESPNRLQGDIYALVSHPFARVEADLKSPQHWCDVLLLHINTKYCYPVPLPNGTVLRVHVGKKTAEELVNTSRVEFSYQVSQMTPDYLEVKLSAAQGPLGTSDYRVELEAVALAGEKTFLHLSYSYAMSFAARLAMQTYLATVGSDKVGFTAIGGQTSEPADLIGGVRGLVERNTMRYFLAIDSFLEFSSAQPAARFEQSLQSWFTAVEHYPRQLHEMNRTQYLEMKRSEYQRQQTLR